jgi:hypothetical protein
LISYANIIPPRVITAYLSWANKRHEQRRIALGKPGKVVDTSLDDGSKEKKITSEDGEVAANEQSFLDLTDRQVRLHLLSLHHVIDLPPFSERRFHLCPVITTETNDLCTISMKMYFTLQVGFHSFFFSSQFGIMC